MEGWTITIPNGQKGDLTECVIEEGIELPHFPSMNISSGGHSKQTTY